MTGKTMILLDVLPNGVVKQTEPQPYDGRHISDREAINLHGYEFLKLKGYVRYWVMQSGHDGFLILIK